MNPLLQTYFNDRRKAINEALDSYLTAPPGCPPELMEAMRYSALAPGKRLRPVLAIAGAEAVGGAQERVMPTACAIELIHAFSLVHDDLPALDNDTLRRGLPTLHIKFGEAMAILAGDALLAMAFDLIGINVSTASPEQVCRTLSIVSRATGTDGMVAGQALDILSEGKEADQSRVEYIHTHKTAALIRASVVSGAILSGAGDEQITLLEEYGLCIGMAFQIADDVLNVTGDAGKLGKAVGSDAGRGKATYPAVFGVDASYQAAADLVQRAKKTLFSFGSSAQPLQWIADFIIERKV